jgi:hypothetical protein
MVRLIPKILQDQSLAKYSLMLEDNSKVSISVSRFASNWDASGQIPQRLVDNGTISRFGAVDIGRKYCKNKY